MWVSSAVNCIFLHFAQWQLIPCPDRDHQAGTGSTGKGQTGREMSSEWETWQSLICKLHLRAYQSAFSQVHCAAFPALLPQGFISDPHWGESNALEMNTPTHAQRHGQNSEREKRTQKTQGTWEPKCGKLASGLGFGDPFLVKVGRSKENHKCLWQKSWQEQSHREGEDGWELRKDWVWGLWFPSPAGFPAAPRALSQLWDL